MRRHLQQLQFDTQIALSCDSSLQFLRVADGSSHSAPPLLTRCFSNFLSPVSLNGLACFGTDGVAEVVSLDRKTQPIHFSSSSCQRTAFNHLPTGMLFHANDDNSFNAQRLWPSQHRHLVMRLEGHRDRILAIDGLPSIPSTLFTGSMDGTVLSWDLNRMLPIGNLQKRRSILHNDFVTSLSHLSSSSFCSQILFSGSADGTIRMWDARSLPLTTSSSSIGCLNVGSAILSLVTSEISSIPKLYSASSDGIVRSFDLRFCREASLENLVRTVCYFPVHSSGNDNTHPGRIRSLSLVPPIKSGTSPLLVSVEEKNRVVKCFEAEGGKVKWETSFGDSVDQLSNAVVIGDAWRTERTGGKPPGSPPSPLDGGDLMPGGSYASLYAFIFGISNGMIIETEHIQELFHFITNRVMIVIVDFTEEERDSIVYSGGGWTLLLRILRYYLNQTFDDSLIIQIRELIRIVQLKIENHLWIIENDDPLPILPSGRDGGGGGSHHHHHHDIIIPPAPVPNPSPAPRPPPNVILIEKDRPYYVPVIIRIPAEPKLEEEEEEEEEGEVKRPEDPQEGGGDTYELFHFITNRVMIEIVDFTIKERDLIVYGGGSWILLLELLKKYRSKTINESLIVKIDQLISIVVIKIEPPETEPKPEPKPEPEPEPEPEREGETETEGEGEVAKPEEVEEKDDELGNGYELYDFVTIQVMTVIIAFTVEERNEIVYGGGGWAMLLVVLRRYLEQTEDEALIVKIKDLIVIVLAKIELLEEELNHLKPPPSEDDELKEPQHGVFDSGDDVDPSDTTHPSGGFDLRDDEERGIQAVGGPEAEFNPEEPFDPDSTIPPIGLRPRLVDLDDKEIQVKPSDWDELTDVLDVPSVPPDTLPHFDLPEEDPEEDIETDDKEIQVPTPPPGSVGEIWDGIVDGEDNIDPSPPGPVPTVPPEFNDNDDKNHQVGMPQIHRRPRRRRPTNGGQRPNGGQRRPPRRPREPDIDNRMSYSLPLDPGRAAGFGIGPRFRRDDPAMSDGIAKPLDPGPAASFGTGSRDLFWLKSRF